VNALDAADGSVVWSRNAASDTGAEVPDWGFTSSPLVVGDVVIVHAGVLVAYDLATGEPQWFGPDRGGSYSSPHPVTLDGVRQVLMQSGEGATSVAPADGTVLWQHPWAGNIVQPALTADGEILISAGGATGGLGIRRVAVARAGGPIEHAELRGSGGWTIEEGWTSTGLKPNFSDFVVHRGHAYGFDGRILACIGLDDGRRKWKGGRYGSGHGTTRCWSMTCCWSATARRWSPSGCRSRRADESRPYPRFRSARWRCQSPLLTVCRPETSCV
jgi:outer membrane protein assembly factor BamB